MNEGDDCHSPILICFFHFHRWNCDDIEQSITVFLKWLYVVFKQIPAGMKTAEFH